MPALKPHKPAAHHSVVQPHKAAVLKRLNRIEGQVRGVARMVEDDRYCIDVITQLAAARAALDAVALHLLEDHTRGCVQSAIKSNRGKPALDELMLVMRKFAR
jgi:CsoR family transcriptional regulator, copper-sensing transcriptional repressor